MLLGGTPGSSARTVVHAHQSPDTLDHELDLHRRHAIWQICRGQVWAKRPLRACLSKQFQWVARIGGLEEHTGLVPTSIGQAPNGRLPAQDLHRGQDGYYGSSITH